MSGPTLPPATPTYILRGHNAAIHALQIFNGNLRLVSGDADGWIVVWDLIFKRPVAVWKAHEGAVLEVKGFSLSCGRVSEIYTHGRDHKLRVWRFKVADEEILSKTLPVDQPPNKPDSDSQIKPWLVHSLYVNALNFCAFSMLVLPPSPSPSQMTEDSDEAPQDKNDTPPTTSLIAVPNALDSGAIDLFHLPSERRICTIPTDSSVKTGMVMAARLIRTSNSKDLRVAAAFEDGHVMVFGCRGVFQDPAKSLVDSSRNWKWERLYLSRPHTQPVLSLDLVPSGEYFLTSSADAVIARHAVPESAFDARDTPIKSLNTKHAGQQGLRVRSDGKIFATAGWDSRVRVYSCKSLKELAVLKWHKEGCYAVAFADAAGSTDTTTPAPTESPDATAQSTANDRDSADEQSLTRQNNAYTLAQAHHARSLKVQTTHWLVAGSKDGKISLWDIY
ncbi:WD40 repeat domain-containing protein [Aspergillus stella-maris]|uniref:WD40 repeat domain-containing protein n=1 Tax=Aspergillus stella-maris TaxID=1810926 RepID=UPI003CCDA531